MATKFRAIACIGKNYEIGKDGKLIWKLASDMKVFSTVTKWTAVIMGRKTWESIGKKSLPFRLNIVLSKDPSYKADDAITFPSFEAAKTFLNGEDIKEAWIIGGSKIYETALPDCEELFLTRIDEPCDEADTYFPEFEVATSAEDFSKMKNPFYLLWKSTKYNGNNVPWLPEKKREGGGETQFHFYHYRRVRKS